MAMLFVPPQAWISSNPPARGGCLSFLLAQWGLWGSSASSQGWARSLEGPETAACQISRLGDVCFQRV